MQTQIPPSKKQLKTFYKALIDPHGDLAEEIKGFLAMVLPEEEAAERIIYVDPAYEEILEDYYFGLKYLKPRRKSQQIDTKEKDKKSELGETIEVKAEIPKSETSPELKKSNI